MSHGMLKVLQPEGWAPAKGYANGIAARGEMVFVAGMIGWNGQWQFETDDFVGECKQALQKSVATLACAGAGPEHVETLAGYVKDKQYDLADGVVLGQCDTKGMGHTQTAITV